MRVLGISGRYREAAAALAIDGQVIAGASEERFVRVPSIGYAQTGGFPGGAVDACLTRVAMTLDDIDEVVVVDDQDRVELPPAAVDASPRGWPAMRRRAGPAVSLEPVRADAEQAAATADDARAVLVCSSHPAAIVTFAKQGDRLLAGRPVVGASQLLEIAEGLATTLGLPTDDPYRSLDRLSLDSEAEFLGELDTAIQWDSSSGIDVDRATIGRLIRRLASDDQELADASSLNRRIQEARHTLAASFTHRLAEIVGHVIEDTGRLQSGSRVAVGGGMFGNPSFNTELRRLVGDRIARAAVPEVMGRALGAAIASSRRPDRLTGLSLGPTYSDHDIKRTLDNCRLDYVYEPDWSRLLLRVSRMLQQGKVVAWFQGPMAFGPRPLGSRSVLCDPSVRYARQNINEFFRHVPLAEPLPLVFAPAVAAQCVGAVTSSAADVVDVAIAAEWQTALAGALDRKGRARVQALSVEQAPQLCDLADMHYQRTNVPGLIETNLASAGEPIACTPRDAVRTVYSSALDALVIGRFLLMKDYWLLRSDGA